MKETEKTKKDKDKDKEILSLEEMAQAGLQFGHRTSRTHPKMKPYISKTKNSISLIDLSETLKGFEKVLSFIQKLISENKTLLLIGTKIQAKDLVKESAEDCNLPYVNQRWLGGIITNFSVIKKRVDHFKDLEKQKKEGGLEKYTKKERGKIDKALKDFEIKFGGIKNLEKLPDAIFVLDMKKDNLAIREARKKGITVIGIADTNINPELADYLIPANDDAISSLKYILEKVKEAILKTKSKIQNPNDKSNPKSK